MGGLFSRPDAPPAQKLVNQSQYDQALAEFDKTTADPGYDVGMFGAIGADQRKSVIAGRRQSLIDSMLVAPLPAPDLASQMVTSARSQARRRLLSGQALTGPIDMTPGASMVPGLKGY